MKKILISALLITLYGCGGGGSDDTDSSPIPPEPTSYTLSGNFEKGPFIIGSEISIQEFNDSLVSTGKTFHTETISNIGNYNIDLSLTEEVVEVSADGYYFNEISGQLSNSKLRLTALANASDNENININILTHLSKKRIKTLVSNGSDFGVAKRQAEEEVQELFNFVSADWEINDFDRMKITEFGDNNSYLLLISAIIQNINISTSQLSEYIERLAQDLSDNGVVNDSALIESINLSAQTVNLPVVRTNLTTRYDELGEAVNLPNFELLLNRQPVANAGEDLTGSVGAEITLDGSLSTDIDNDSLTYQWTLIESPEGSVASLSDESSVSPTIIPDMLGSYSVELIVSDGELTSNADVVVISPENQVPVADAGDDLFITVGSSISLDGSNSFDPEDEVLTYLWTSGDLELTHSEALWDIGIVPAPSIEPWDHSTSWELPLPPQTIFTLTVTDSQDLSDSDEVTVSFGPSYTDNQDGTISDGFGNMWQQEDSDEIIDGNSWGADGMWTGDPSPAMEYCDSLSLAGFNDWRLPSVAELMILVDKSSSSPTINVSFFPNTKSDLYTTSYITRSTSYSIDFNNAELGYDRGYVRCVR